MKIIVFGMYDVPTKYIRAGVASLVTRSCLVSMCRSYLLVGGELYGAVVRQNTRRYQHVHSFQRFQTQNLLSNGYNADTLMMKHLT